MRLQRDTCPVLSPTAPTLLFGSHCMGTEDKGFIDNCQHCVVKRRLVVEGTRERMDRPGRVSGESETQSSHKPRDAVKPRPRQRSNPTLLKLQLKWHQVFLLISLVTLSLFCQASEECPTTCECKWKSGKESVICANSKTKLTSIPNGLEPGTQLLDLSTQNLTFLAGKVFYSSNLVNLQKLFLSGNGLKTLEGNVFYKLNNLVELELSGNKITSVPTHTFDQIPELRELKLNSNPISRISSNAFSTLTRLVRLELSKCRINTLDSAAFRGLVSLEWLKLDNNRLQMIHVVSLYPLRSLHGLELYGNPWNCSCTLQPLRDWMLKNNVPSGVPPVCSEPQRLSGKSWDELQREDFACLPKVQSSILAERGELTKAIEGENATLVCRLQATADTQVRWMNGNKPVVTSSSRYSLSESFVEDGEKEKVTTSSTTTKYLGQRQTLGTKTSRLTVIRAKLRDAGTYSCKAQSRAGSVSANFTLQVLKQGALHVSGRLTIYAVSIAAALTLLISLLVAFLLFCYGRQKKSTILSAEKVELNHIGQNGRMQQNGHASRIQNGGTTIPLLENNNHANGLNGTPVHRPKPGFLGGLQLTKKPQSSANSSLSAGLLNQRYKALPTEDFLPAKKRVDGNEHEADSFLEEDQRSDEDEFGCRFSKKSGVVLINPPDSQPEQTFPDLINEDKSPSLASPSIKSSVPRSMQLSMRPKALLPPPTPVTSTSTSLDAGPINAKILNGKSFQNPTSLHSRAIQHPLNGSTSIPNGESTGNSNCNVLPPKNESPYVPTSHPSTPPTFSKFTFTQRPSPPRHQRTSSFSNSPAHPSPYYNMSSGNPNHISFYRGPQQAGNRPPFQRRSMPTSPIHYPYNQSHGHGHPYSHGQGSDPTLAPNPYYQTQAQEYDYHAAQLASFLEEYRQLQMELMRMSASLTEMTPSPPSSSRLEPFPPQHQPLSNININLMDPNKKGRMTCPNANATANSGNHNQQQFKSILRSSAPNNNYLV